MSHNTEYQLAQLNVAEFLTTRDAPEVTDFIHALDEINTLAEQHDGFIWRLQDEEVGDAMGFTPFGDNMIVNLTVWRDRESLFDYTYKSAHAGIMARRKEWFKKPSGIHFVLWWVPAGHIPTVDEAADRLAILRAEGPSPLAFTFKQHFEPLGF